MTHIRSSIGGLLYCKAHLGYSIAAIRYSIGRLVYSISVLRSLKPHLGGTITRLGYSIRHLLYTKAHLGYSIAAIRYSKRHLGYSIRALRSLSHIIHSYPFILQRKEVPSRIRLYPRQYLENGLTPLYARDIIFIEAVKASYLLSDSDK